MRIFMRGRVSLRGAISSAAISESVTTALRLFFACIISCSARATAQSIGSPRLINPPMLTDRRMSSSPGSRVSLIWQQISCNFC